MSFCPYNKKNITRRLEDMNFIFSLPLENNIYIFPAAPYNILYIYQLQVRIWFWSSAAWPLDLPTSRAQIFSRTRSASDRIFCVFCGNRKWESKDFEKVYMTSNLLELSLSTLCSSSFGKIDTIVFSKLNKAPHSNKPPVSITPPPLKWAWSK